MEAFITDSTFCDLLFSSNFSFFFFSKRSLCFAVVREENHNYCRRKQSKPKLTETLARALQKPNRKLRFWHRFRVPPHSLTSSNMGDKQQRSGGCFLVLSFLFFCTNSSYLALNFDCSEPDPDLLSVDFRLVFVFQGERARRGIQNNYIN